MDKKEKLIKSIEDTEQRLNELKKELKDCDTGYRPQKGEPVLCDVKGEELFGICLEEPDKYDMVLLYLPGYNGHSGHFYKYDDTYYAGGCRWVSPGFIKKLPEIP